MFSHQPFSIIYREHEYIKTFYNFSNPGLCKYLQAFLNEDYDIKTVLMVTLKSQWGKVTIAGSPMWVPIWAGWIQNWPGKVEFYIQGKCSKNLVSHTDMQGSSYETIRSVEIYFYLESYIG